MSEMILLPTSVALIALTGVLIFCIGRIRPGSAAELRDFTRAEDMVVTILSTLAGFGFVACLIFSGLTRAVPLVPWATASGAALFILATVVIAIFARLRR